ncbi:hypothetical protein [Streptomyces sp. NPDC046631]|uniref:hypothetical protein n=1 Tax=unclassified Streptomyces TaxID=2593676 RepID=UPI0033CFF941
MTSASTPGHDAPVDHRDQHIADLRAAVQHAVRLLYFSAGCEEATDPKQSARLIAAADGMKDILARTAPREKAGISSEQDSGGE